MTATMTRRGYLVLAAALLLGGCGEQSADSSPSGGHAAETVRIDGSSTVYPVMVRAVRNYQRKDAAASFDIRFSGTTGGFRKFCQGETDISDASRPINAEERAQCEANGVEYIELPLATDAIAVVAPLGNRWLTSLTLDELRRIWRPESTGQALRWKEIRPEWPDLPIGLYGPGKDSGTFDYFTEKVNGVSRASRSDYFGSEDDDELAEKIAGDAGGLGYFGLGVYHRHWETLRLVPIDAGEGAVYPSIETVSAGRYAPLARPLYLYVNRSALASQPALRPFLTETFTGLETWLFSTGYLPMPARVYRENREILAMP